MPEVHGKFVCSTSMSSQMCPGIDWGVVDKASQPSGMYILMCICKSIVLTALRLSPAVP